MKKIEEIIDELQLIVPPRQVRMSWPTDIRGDYDSLYVFTVGLIYGANIQSEQIQQLLSLLEKRKGEPKDPQEYKEADGN